MYIWGWVFNLFIVRSFFVFIRKHCSLNPFMRNEEWQKYQPLWKSWYFMLSMTVSFVHICAMQSCPPARSEDYVLNRMLWNGVLLSFLSTAILAIILREKHCSQYQSDFCIEKGLLCATWYILYSSDKEECFQNIKEYTFSQNSFLPSKSTPQHLGSSWLKYLLNWDLSLYS